MLSVTGKYLSIVACHEIAVPFSSITDTKRLFCTTSFLSQRPYSSTMIDSLLSIKTETSSLLVDVYLQGLSTVLGKTIAMGKVIKVVD